MMVVMNSKIVSAITWVAIALGFISILVFILVYAVIGRASQEEITFTDPLDVVSKSLADSYQSTGSFPTSLNTLYEPEPNSPVEIDYTRHETGYCASAAYLQGGVGSSKHGAPTYHVKEDRVRRLGICPPEGLEWKSLHHGSTFAIGWGTDNELYVWGEGNRGELGLGEGNKIAHEPERMDRSKLFDDGTITQVATGENHAIAVTDNKQIYTWGRGDARLGQGKHRSTNVFTPTKIELPEEAKDKTVLQVAASRLNGYALMTDGAIYAWGSDSSGQLGTSEPMPQHETGMASPTQVEMIELIDDNRIVQLVTSPFGTQVYALDSEGVLYGWGSNTRNSLTMVTDDEVVDVPIMLLDETEFDDLRFDSVSTSSTHTVALTKDNLLFAWGNSAFGQYGNGTTQRQTEPMPVDMSRMRGQTIQRVAVGPHVDDRYSIAFVDGGMFVWGANSYGLFDHDDVRIRRPIFVPSVYAS